MSVKRFLALFSTIVIVMLSLSVGYFYFFYNKVTTTEYSQEGGQTVLIESSLPGYKIESSNKNQELLNAYLRDSGFWDSRTIDGSNRQLALQSVKFVFTDEEIETFIQIGEEKLTAMNFQLDEDSSSLTVTIQLTQFLLDNVSIDDIEKMISARMKEAMHVRISGRELNSININEDNSDLDKKIIEFSKSSDKFVILTKQVSLNLVKEVKANHCSGNTYSTGVSVLVQLCNGGFNDGNACTTSLQCPGGGTCEGSNQCNMIGTATCSDQPLAGGGHACAPSGLYNCSNESCSSIPPVLPPPPPPTCNNNGTCDSGENNSNCPGDCPASAPTTPPGWGACGGCTANSCQTQYSRTDAGGNCVCDPTGCGYAPPTPSDPRCVVQNNIGPTTFYAGQTGQVVSNVNYYDGGTYSSHNFTSSDQTVLQLVAGQNANGARTVLRKNVAALVPGTSIFRTNVALSNGSPPSCSRGRTITVLPVPSWWQVTGGGDVIVEGDITSNIPESCTTDETAGGTCRDEFIVEDTDSLKPGAVIYQGPATALDFRLTTSSGGNANIGGLAGPSWTSNAAYTPVLYNYDYFEALSSGKTFVNTSGSINTGTINGATADADGYVWIKNVGDLQISSPINLAGTKAIIFVQDGDLIIDSEIRLNNTATGFVMFVVGDDGTGTKGNIIIDPSVGNNSLSATTPNITGVFWADGQISTGTDGPQSDTRKLIMYGSFAALRGFNLQRSLSSTDNQTSPAEVFQYGPEFQLNFPQTLSSKRLIWREVAP